MAKSKLVKANEKIARQVTGAFDKIENAVVGGYTKIEDAFVDQYLTKDGETVAQAKERLRQEQARREKEARDAHSSKSIKTAEHTCTKALCRFVFVMAAGGRPPAGGIPGGCSGKTAGTAGRNCWGCQSRRPRPTCAMLSSGRASRMSAPCMMRYFSRYCMGGMWMVFWKQRRHSRSPMPAARAMSARVSPWEKFSWMQVSICCIRTSSRLERSGPRLLEIGGIVAVQGHADRRQLVPHHEFIAGTLGGQGVAGLPERLDGVGVGLPVQFEGSKGVAAQQGKDVLFGKDGVLAAGDQIGAEHRRTDLTESAGVGAVQDPSVEGDAVPPRPARTGPPASRRSAGPKGYR